MCICYNFRNMHILDNVLVWNLFRGILDQVFGMYSKNMEQMREFGVERSMSVLDVGCGTGHYSQLTEGEYLGIDSDLRYIDAARKRFGTERRQFVCSRLQDMNFGGRKFNAVLLIDLTHHIPTEDFRSLMSSLSRITQDHLIIFDPVKQRSGNLIGRFLTSIDRGKYIRPKEEEIGIIREYFDVVSLKESCDILHIDGIGVLARPKPGL